VRRHSLDIVSLVFGLFFLGAAVVWGFGGGDVVRRTWGIPTLLIAVGVIGLLAALPRLLSRDDD